MLKNETIGSSEPKETPSNQQKIICVGEGSFFGAVIDISLLLLPLIIAFLLMSFFDGNNIKDIFLLSEWAVISISIVLLTLTKRIITTTQSKKELSRIASGIKLYSIVLALCLFFYIISFIASREYFVFNDGLINALAIINPFLFLVSVILYLHSIVVS